MALQIQSDQSPNYNSQPRFGGATTDLSLATPGLIPSFKSTKRGKPNIIMSRVRFNGNGPRLELRLNLSPTRAVGLGPGSQAQAHSPRPGSVSPPSSCVSSEVDEVEPATLMMVVVGCPRCLMYVMIVPAEDGRYSRCPRCKSQVLLDVVNEPTANGAVTPATAGGGAKRVRTS